MGVEGEDRGPPPKKAFALRLEPSLYEALERCAAAELRSVNAEIECLLREALRARGVKLEPPQKRPRGRPRNEGLAAPSAKTKS